MTRRRGAQDTILSDKQLLHSIGRTDLSNQLDDLRVVIPPITTNDEESSLGTFWYGLEDGCDEVLGIVGFLEHDDFLAEAGTVRFNWAMLDFGLGSRMQGMLRLFE